MNHFLQSSLTSPPPPGWVSTSSVFPESSLLSSFFTVSPLWTLSDRSEKENKLGICILLASSVWCHCELAPSPRQRSVRGPSPHSPLCVPFLGNPPLFSPFQKGVVLAQGFALSCVVSLSTARTYVHDCFIKLFSNFPI